MRIFLVDRHPIHLTIFALTKCQIRRPPLRSHLYAFCKIFSTLLHSHTRPVLETFRISHFCLRMVTCWSFRIFQPVFQLIHCASIKIDAFGKIFKWDLHNFLTRLSLTIAHSNFFFLLKNYPTTQIEYSTNFIINILTFFLHNKCFDRLHAFSLLYQFSHLPPAARGAHNVCCVIGDQFVDKFQTNWALLGRAVKVNFVYRPKESNLGDVCLLKF